MALSPFVCSTRPGHGDKLKGCAEIGLAIIVRQSRPSPSFPNAALGKRLTIDADRLPPLCRLFAYRIAAFSG